MRVIKRLVLISTLALTLQGCFSSDNTNSIVDPVNCTGVFVTSSIVVLNPAGTPLDSVKITVQNKNSNRYYDLCENETCYTNQQGAAAIMNDAFRDHLKEEGGEIIVTGSKDNLSFEEEFEFKPGVCHIQKVAGPDTVTLSSNSSPSISY
ncbi:hypothetical protein [Fodinibius salsisoli]|uniref:Lipoprotein n=1 Tax=Fodinibius salsisoli TaxID=2820877 RepID=A0ABT3PST8_9BACT|nr:hypothetical protein [Fodinibius salsisoli]MCW9708934.1 hypothetical protein [Fodinibius salsisoli]